MAEQKKRGVPKGTKRQIVWSVGSVNSSGELVMSRISAQDRETAAKEFHKEYNLEAQSVDGPFYAKSERSQNRLTVDVSADQIAFTGKQWLAEIQGCEVIAMGLRGVGSYQDNQLVAFLPASSDSKKPRLGAAKSNYVPFDRLENPRPKS